jgi:DnaJ-class molecular chaperone
MFYQGQMYQRLSRFRVAGQDLYSTLEADSGLTDTELKAKYKKLVLKYHPDKNR